MIRCWKLLIIPSSSYFLRNMTHKVFVYGTLKRNEPNHHWLTNPDHGEGRFISEGVTKNKYPLVIATKYNIPFLLYSPGKGNHVQGEIYEVDDVMLSKLDILEDHPNYYIREIDEINALNQSTDKQEVHKCWVYFLKQFKPDLLSKPTMDNYSSSGPHGLVYMESHASKCPPLCCRQAVALIDTCCVALLIMACPPLFHLRTVILWGTMKQKVYRGFYD